MTVGELLRRMSASELRRWSDYERKHGEFGPGRADAASAVVAKTVADVNRPKGQDPYPFHMFFAYQRPELDPDAEHEDDEADDDGDQLDSDVPDGEAIADGWAPA